MTSFPDTDPITAAMADFAHGFYAALDTGDLAWLDDAECANRGLGIPDMFPQQGGNATGGTEAGLAACAACPVLADCTSWMERTGRSRDRHGIWAGTTGAARLRRG